jgi:ADP-ribose pyrophosphatase YjhB (NUDIX family)
MRNNQVLVSGAVVYKKAKNGRRYWLIAKQSEDDKWEIPKVVVRKGESSVRAAIRMMGEVGGMSAKVLEEAGRAGGSTTIRGKVVPKRHLYYLMVQKSAGEMLGFNDHAWVAYAKAVRKLSLKREKEMLKNAKKELLQWLKKREKMQQE